MRSLAVAAAALLTMTLGACAAQVESPLPSGAAAYDAIPVQVMDQRLAQRIRAGDRLAIRVFGEPELTSDQYRVDSTGFLQVPLVGQIIAAGVTPEELRAELTRRLGARFIRDPQVYLVGKQSVNQEELERFLADNESTGWRTDTTWRTPRSCRRRWSNIAGVMPWATSNSRLMRPSVT